MTSRRKFIQHVGTLGLTAVTVGACSAPEGSRPTLTARTAVSVESPPLARQARSPSNPLQSELPPQPQDALADDIPQAAPAEPAPETGSDRVDRSIVATAAVSKLQVFNIDGDVTHVLDNPTMSNGPLVFLTTRSAQSWHQVLLPVRPNGSTGWVRDQDVTLSGHNYRMQVDLADFRCRVFDRGETVFDSIAGVAAANSPTPGGIYYITELISPIIPNSVYGPFAYGLSGFSEVFETFNGGPGQLGVHGTNDPSSLGSGVSSGCVRLHNDEITELAQFLPLGVPVTII